MTLTDVGTTPHRATTITFDVPEAVLVSDAWGYTRLGGEIAKPITQGKAVDDQHAPNVYYWPDRGYWTLRPIHVDVANIQEYIEFAHLVIPSGGFNLPTGWATIAGNTDISLWRQSSDLPGMIYNAAIAATGDPHIVKRIPAGTSWAQAVASGYYAPFAGDVVLDRCGESKSIYAEESGFFLRFKIPSISDTYPSYIWSFYFGQYCVSFRGSGKCDLYEFCKDKNNVNQWRKRTTFAYSDPSQIGGVAHTLAIWPHIGANGERNITFSNSELDAAGFVSGFANTDTSGTAPKQFTYTFSNALRNGDQDSSPGHVTKADIIRFDVRRDIKLQKQISTLGWAKDGFLLDVPSTMPPYLAGTETVTLTPYTSTPAATTIVGSMYDVKTGNTYRPGIDSQPQVRFDFHGDGTTTPILWGYNIFQGAVINNLAPGPFTVTNARPNAWEQISITGSDGDPSHASAHVRISDQTFAFPRLQNRGQLSAKISTTFKATDGTSQSAVIFRGQAIRPHAVKMGAGTSRAYPSQFWADLDISMLGMWRRLAKRVQGTVERSFANDAAAPRDPLNPGALVPWKVTDAMREVLKQCGFSNADINIPNLPYRLYTGKLNKAADDTILSESRFDQLLATWARNYLGGYLIWDENSNGGLGQWTVIFSPVADVSGNYTPVWNFTTFPTAGIAPHLPGRYTAGTSPVWSGASSYVIPPEFNRVTVICPTILTSSKDKIAILNYMANPLSYNVPGFGTTADPNHPDYIGDCYGSTIIDPSLGGVTDLETQRNVDFVCRRIFDFNCHAQRITSFRAPLNFIYDARISAWRPLRTQDPVSFNGNNNYIIKSVQIEYASDGVQEAEYELIRPVIF